MLNGNFYTIDTLDNSGNSIKASISIDASHPIFRGHFPSVPVVPGVCMVQIIKELLTDALRQDLILRKADHLKFMSVINPVETRSVRIEIQHAASDGNFAVSAAIVNEGITYFKFKGVFGAE